LFAYEAVVLILSLHVHQLCINLLIKFSGEKKKQKTSETLWKINSSSTFILSLLIDFIHGCHHCLKMSSFSLKKNKFWSINLTCLLAINITTAFTILKCLEHESLKRFLVQGQQQSFWKFFILSNIPDLEWCLLNKWKFHSQLSAMFNYWDGKGSRLSNQA